MATEYQQGYTESGQKRPRYIFRRIVLVIIILGAGLLLASHFIKTKPKIQKRPMEKQPPLVSVVPLHPGSEIIRITAMGTVVPAKQIVLKAPVGGEILDIAGGFTPGGFLEEGETAVRIDPQNYELTLLQKQKALSDAEYAARLEQGRQDVARREWNLLYGGDRAEGAESDLALRRPHLEKVEADIRAARAEVELARLNLSKTAVKSPFKSLVLNTYVDKGAYASPQEKLADLAGADEYWVQVSIPLDRLQWLTIPRSEDESGSPARVFYRENGVRQGRILRLLGDLSKQGRMARLLVSVPDPLGLSGKDNLPPLLIDEYVRVEIEGREVREVFSLPRIALRNDREIWLVDGDGKLAVRPVDIVWRGKDHVLVREGLRDGDLLVVSNLATPVDGMSVRIDDEKGNGMKTEAGNAMETR